MSHFTNSIVEPDGPIINVLIALSAPRRAALVAAGQEIPDPMPGRLLIDTGASMTSIDQKFVTGLALQPTGSINMHTPSTGATSVPMSSYDVELHFKGFDGAAHTFQSMAVLGCDFSGQNIDGLFGRDALALARLFYSGPDASWMMSF
jgi:hypothetical protein